MPGSRTLPLVLLLLLLTAPLMAQETRLRIVASHSIAADVMARVAGDDAELMTLIPRGADPHSFRPAPSDLRALADADLVFINGADFEELLLPAIEQSVAADALVSLSTCVPILPGGHAEDEHGEEEHHDEEHADEPQEAMEAQCARHEVTLGTRFQALQDDHDSPGPLHSVDCQEFAGCDPHVWLLPRNVAHWTLVTRDALSARDPGRAEAYQQRSAEFLDEIAALEQDVLLPRIASLPPDRRLLVSNHRALRYFAGGYGFELAGSVLPGHSTLVEPGLAQLAELIDLLRARKVPAVFSETTASDDFAQLVAAESGAQLVLLHTGSLGAADGPAGTWLALMRSNVEAIVAALSDDAAEA